MHACATEKSKSPDEPVESEGNGIQLMDESGRMEVQPVSRFCIDGLGWVVVFKHGVTGLRGGGSTWRV